MVRTAETRLIVLRGNRASGKSSVASALRDRFGRGLALVVIGADSTLHETVDAIMLDTGLAHLPAWRRRHG